MPIIYALFENNLTTDPADCAAQVQYAPSMDLEDIVAQIIDQGSTVTEADIMAVLMDAIKVTENFILQGHRVNFGGLFEMFPRVKGVFTDIGDVYDPARHYVDVGANPGSRVRETVRKDASVQKAETALPLPSPLQFFDLASGEVNGNLTPSNIGTLKGHRLNYDEAQADEGIFFINVSTEAETKVTTVQKNKPGEQVFLTPALADASYWLEVRKRFTDTGDLRTGRLPDQLTCGPI